MYLLPERSVTTLDHIHCMDALSLLRGLATNSVDMVLTDFPYGEINHVARLHERAKYGNVLRNLHKGNADIADFDLMAILTELDRVTKGFLYIFCGTSQCGIVRNFFTERYMTRHCVWEKTNPTPQHGQYIWMSSIENCICVRKPLTRFNEFCKSAVWRFPSGSSKLTPTQKPVSLFRYLIQSSTVRGDVVLDPFIGSGTTAIAAHGLNRRYIGADINAGYVRIARRRAEIPYMIPMFDELPDQSIQITKPIVPVQQPLFAAHN